MVEWNAFKMNTNNGSADCVYHNYFNFNLSAKSLLNLAGILSNRERNLYMSQPLAKIDTSAHPADAAAPKPRETGPKPLAFTGVVTRQASPVHDLQSDVERAFAARAMTADERKIPFAVTLAGVTAFSLTCWTLLYLLARAL